MARFWDACPSRACGFKILSAQIRPTDKLSLIFKRALHTHRQEGPNSEEPVRRILLERRDIDAEFQSWRRAQNTGNWGTTPEAQARVELAALEQGANRSQGTAFRDGCRGCDAEAVSRNQALANSVGPLRFAAQHRQWFRLARDLAPPPSGGPQLHIYTEDITSDLFGCNRTMERVYRFLHLPPLPNNCDTSRIPAEWECDIQHDPLCSLEKYRLHTRPPRSS